MRARAPVARLERERSSPLLPAHSKRVEWQALARSRLRLLKTDSWQVCSPRLSPLALLMLAAVSIVSASELQSSLPARAFSRLPD